MWEMEHLKEAGNLEGDAKEFRARGGAVEKRGDLWMSIPNGY